MSIPAEPEIILENNKSPPKIRRNGLPQGLSLSPILATSVLAQMPDLGGLVMYADDGLIIREDHLDDDEVD
jgi:hypothetical protein